MNKQTLTASQVKALEILRAGKFQKKVTKDGRELIKTGVNTTTLHSLRSMDLIDCKNVYLGGWVTGDLVVS